MSQVIKANSKFLHNIARIAIYVLLVILSSMYLFPFLWMISTALKTPEEMFSGGISLIPAAPQWGNFVKAVVSIPVLLYTKNTLTITIGVMVGVLISSSLVAYAFARLRWPGRDIWFIILLSTLMLPAQVVMIPSFVLFKWLGWINSFKPLIVPAFFGGGAFNIFLLRQFFKSIPNELSESARIDGCSEFRIWAEIMLPLCKPVLATIAIFTFMGCWNDFFGPLLYIYDPDKITIALGLRAFQMQHGAQWDLMMAGAVLSMIPTLALFFSCQKYFVEGITLTGIKG